MRIEAMAGAWWAADYLCGRKPIAARESNKATPAKPFAATLDEKMERINEGGALCLKNSESLTLMRR